MPHWKEIMKRIGGKGKRIKKNGFKQNKITTGSRPTLYAREDGQIRSSSTAEEYYCFPNGLQ